MAARRDRTGAVCFKYLWVDFEKLLADEAAPQDIAAAAAADVPVADFMRAKIERWALSEATTKSRWWCKGFFRYSPGRTPKEHKVLEDERRGHRRNLWVAAIAFAGALLGASLPTLINWLGGSKP